MENFIYSDYFTHIKKDSLLIPGKRIADKENSFFSCPRCGARRSDLEHSGIYQCSECKLGLRRYGNSLEIWED